ncbi:MAG: hypothetical protein ACRDPC_04615 [Solirubrobacteraceae bacterium]
MSGVPTLLLGLLLLGLGVVLLYLLLTLWPAVDAAKEGGDGSVTWLWTRLDLTADTTLLLLVILVSAVGSYVHVTVSFSDFAGNRQLVSSWVWWYLLRVFVGSSLAVLFYFAIRGGFFSSASDSSQVNVYGIAALSGLVGLFSKQATDKLREIFDTAFRTQQGYGDDARSDGIANPAPTLESSEPARIGHDELDVVLVGTGFTKDSIVKVSQVGGIEEPRTVSLVGPTELKVTLLAHDIETPGILTFTVVNPEPGGGASNPLAVQVGPTNGAAKVTEAAKPKPSRQGRAAQQ